MTEREVIELRMTEGLWVKLRLDFIESVLKDPTLYGEPESKQQAIEMLDELRKHFFEEDA